MTRSGRRRRDRVTVDQLLRETGATPRKLDPGARPADRERVERRVEAVAPPAGLKPKAPLVFTGAAVLTAGLVALILSSGPPPPQDQATLPFVPLQPATTAPPSVYPAPPVSATPSPVVMSATRTPSRKPPVVTTTLPEPPPPTTSMPVTTVTLPYYGGGCCYHRR